MRKKTKLLSMLIFTVSVGFAQNFTATYTFDSVKTSTGLIDPTPVPIATGVALGSFSAFGTPANSKAASRFSFADWPTGATDGNDNYSSLTGAVNTSEYYEVTISPENGYKLELTTITFSVLRSGTGIRTYVVRSSVDGFASNLTASISPSNTKLSVETGNVFFWTADATSTGTDQNGSTITLDGNYSNLSTPVTFRFYGYNAEKSLGTFSIDNVTFSGTVNAVSTTIKNLNTANTLKIYPNPSVDGIINVNAFPGSIITVYNLLGKVIYTKKLSTAFDIINLSDTDNGTYLITMKNDSVINTQQIIICK